MPASWKCTACGLVNFDSDANCKRCLTAAPVPGDLPSSPPSGITLEDGYVLPPPPMSEGIWSDGKTLVMTKGACRPDRCLRCDAPANGYRLRRRLRWHHPALYILIFGAMLLYLILALVLSKHATVDFALCADHVRRRRNLMLGGLGIFLFALTLLVVAFSYDYAMIGLSAVLLFFAAIIWLIIAYKVVTVKRIDDRYIWLTGLDEKYLVQFPPLAGNSPQA